MVGCRHPPDNREDAIDAPARPTAATSHPTAPNVISQGEQRSTVGPAREVNSPTLRFQSRAHM
jgi:hypothetical protein